MARKAIAEDSGWRNGWRSSGTNPRRGEHLYRLYRIAQPAYLPLTKSSEELDREQWYWRDCAGPDLAKLRRQHDGLRAALLAEGVELVEVPGSRGDVKAVFTRDMAIAIDGGAIVCQM